MSFETLAIDVIVIGMYILWGVQAVPLYKTCKERGDTDVFFCLIGTCVWEIMWAYFVDKVHTREDRALFISLQCTTMLTFSAVALNSDVFIAKLIIIPMFLRLVFFIFK